MTKSLTSTLILVSTATVLSSMNAMADCPVELEHPSHVPFEVSMDMASDINRDDDDADFCENMFLKQVPVWNDGSYGYDASCGVGSFGDITPTESYAWAHSDATVSMQGLQYENGFQISLVEDVLTSAYNGSTTVQNQYLARYKFKLGGDARYTFYNETFTDWNDADMLVELVNLDTGESWDLTHYFNDIVEDADPIAAGNYELRMFLSFHQDGPDEYDVWTVSDVEMNFYCDYFYRIGDINKDDIINGLDLSYLLSAFNSYDSEADLNGDGKVDGSDLSYLLSAWD